MRRLKLVGSTAVGIVIGATLLNAVPAYADLPTIDAGAIAAIEAVKGVLDTVSSTHATMSKPMLTTSTSIAIGDTPSATVQQLLQEGFTQEANYSKATDRRAGSRSPMRPTRSMAQFDRHMRNAQIRDQQTASPTACVALDGGVSTQAAAVQAYQVAEAISRIHDVRGEAVPSMPSYYGAGPGCRIDGARASR